MEKETMSLIIENGLMLGMTARESLEAAMMAVVVTGVELFEDALVCVYELQAA